MSFFLYLTNLVVVSIHITHQVVTAMSPSKSGNASSSTHSLSYLPWLPNSFPPNSNWPLVPWPWSMRIEESRCCPTELLWRIGYGQPSIGNLVPSPLSHVIKLSYPYLLLPPPYALLYIMFRSYTSTKWILYICTSLFVVDQYDLVLDHIWASNEAYH